MTADLQGVAKIERNNIILQIMWWIAVGVWIIIIVHRREWREGLLLGVASTWAQLYFSCVKDWVLAHRSLDHALDLIVRLRGGDVTPED